MLAVGDASPRRRRALERHLDGCAACRDDRAVTAALYRALEAMPAEASVPDALEQATFRRVRMLDAPDAPRGRVGWWRSWFALPAVALATAAVAVLALGVVRTTTPPADDATPRIASAKRTPERAPRVARSTPSRVAPEPPVEPPPELAAAPDLFVDMPILRNMEKLQHFEAIRTTTVDDDTPNG
jgi:anti-sigma factor RsiW